MASNKSELFDAVGVSKEPLFRNTFATGFKLPESYLDYPISKMWDLVSILECDFVSRQRKT